MGNVEKTEKERKEKGNKRLISYNVLLMCVALPALASVPRLPLDYSLVVILFIASKLCGLLRV